MSYKLSKKFVHFLPFQKQISAVWKMKERSSDTAHKAGDLSRVFKADILCCVSLFDVRVL